VELDCVLLCCAITGRDRASTTSVPREAVNIFLKFNGFSLASMIRE